MPSRRQLLAFLGLAAAPPTIVAAAIVAQPAPTPRVEPIVGMIIPRTIANVRPRDMMFANSPYETVLEVEYVIWDGNFWIALDSDNGRALVAKLGA